VNKRRSQPVLTPVEILDLRHFGSSELRPLLEREAKVWSERMNWDYRSSTEMILRYLDSKILPGYVTMDDHHITGYSFFIYEGGKGVIGDLFAEDTLAEAESLQEQLLKHVIETLQQSPATRRIEAQLLLHDAGVIASPFRQAGFQQYSRLFMSLKLGSSRQKPPLKKRPEVVLRGWQEQDFQTTANIITAAYHGHVDSQINDQYRSIPGSMRFLNNIVRFPGCGVFDAASSFVAVHKVTKAIIGLLLTSRVRDDVGHVTQVCVLPEYRNLGIAQALIENCAQALERRGFTELSLTVTEVNAPAVDLYLRLGFTRQRVFDAFVWEE
jgi:ribosomal protein S18 acetylase RimI-like enzyme